MDREHQLVRNSQVQDQTAELPSSASSPSTNPGVLVDVIVLSGDLSLFEAIRRAVGERNPVWRARSAEESVELLLAGRCGVLLIDMAVLSTQPATLVEQIVERFPDVVIVVAGRRDDVALLARLISDGLVYRFMHKPLSPKRAGMFLNAAIRSHVERHGGRALAPQPPRTEEPSTRSELRKWAFVTTGLVLFMTLLALLLLESRRALSPAASPAVAAPPQPVADPVLSGARAALAAGRYEAPAGRNALDLFAAVLLARPAHPEARAGLDETAARLVALATRETQAGNVDEARRLVGRVLAVDPSHASARTLQARLDAPVPVAMPPAMRADTLVPPAAPSAPAQPARPDTPSPAPPTATARPTAIGESPAAGPRLDRTTSARRTANHGTGNSFGPPITSGLPTAGYVTSPATPEPVAQPEQIIPIDAKGALPDRDLEHLVATEPAYPQAALRDRVEGWVEIDYTVTESGSVRDIEIIAAEPRGVFEAAARAAIGQWRFQPRVVNGRPVPQRSSVTFRFNVED